MLADRFSVLVGHSGVGKSTLINALIPQTDRQVGTVNVLTGKGRHTSTSSEALPLPGGGWVVDTPGVRSFGLSHATTEDVLHVYPGAAAAVQFCLPNCSHLVDEPSCALDAWKMGAAPFSAEAAAEAEDETTVPLEQRAELVGRLRVLLPGVGNPSD